MNLSTQSRPIKPDSRRRLFAEFTPDNVGREFRTNLILAGESLVGHPDEKAVSGAISWWRAGAARNSDKVCFGCRTAFGIGRAVPGAFLVAIPAGTNASDTAIGGLCTACFHAKTDAEIDAAAAGMLKRLTSPRGQWLDPLPSQVRR